MIENFIEYMWYLLTTPLKKLKKALNKWYILCKVFGRRFDEAKEDILRARDEGMVATCSHEMLPVHGADRRLTRYEGEHPENYRSRIAMYDELCKLGGTNEGVLLAVKTLGYASPVLVRANELTGFVHFTLDGSRTDPSGNRWAEFYIIIAMDADKEHPISFGILRKTVRKWKEVGAKDNYLFCYQAENKNNSEKARCRYLLHGMAVHMEQQALGTVYRVQLPCRNDIQMKITIRHNVWRFDGSYQFNGEKAFSAYIREETL